MRRTRGQQLSRRFGKVRYSLSLQCEKMDRISQRSNDQPPYRTSNRGVQSMKRSYSDLEQHLGWHVCNLFLLFHICSMFCVYIMIVINEMLFFGCFRKELLKLLSIHFRVSILPIQLCTLGLTFGTFTYRLKCSDASLISF